MSKDRGQLDGDVLRAVAVLDDMAAANRCARYIAAQAGEKDLPSSADE